MQECYRTGRPLPKKFQENPHLHQGLEFAYAAFMELNSCRSYGQGTGPIPWTAVVEYARFYGLDTPEVHDLVYYISEMDKEYMDYLSKQQENQRKNAGSSNSRGRISGKKR